MPKVVPEYLEQRRKQILDAAARCFSGSGFHQASIQDICECAELSPGAVYRYFKSKEHLIAAICDESYRQDLALIESIKARGDAHEVMEELGRAFLTGLSQEDVQLKLDLIAEVPRSDHVQETMNRASDAIVSSFAAFIARAQDAGEVNPEIDAEAVARVMCALYHGFIVQKQMNPAVDPDQYFNAVMDVFNGRFFTRPAPRSASSALAD